MNKLLEEKLKTLPRTPGVYFHKSEAGEIIYVGKAAVLKNRVRQYFQSSRGFDNKTLALVNEIYDTDWVETESEIDALFLESEMVKRYMPRYNILLRDDKSQMFVRIDMKSEWPTVTFTRNPHDDGAEYYGPFYNGYALKNAIRYLRKVFPYFIKPPIKESSKLDQDLGLSPRMSEGSEAYKANLRKLISYIKGNRKAITAELEKEMKQAASEQRFEDAGRLRNKLGYMKELQRRVMFGDREFLDISKDKALSNLMELFSLKAIPKRIEGYDISHQGGMNVVASMVVFTNGASDRAEYRKFKTKIEKNDDVGNMYETLFRRFSEKNVKSWGTPDLILIDGGKRQLDAAIKAIDERGIAIPTISIAKREEEIIIHRTKSHISTDFLIQLQEEPVPGVGVFNEGDYIVVNLHLGQRNAGSHSKNLGGGVSLSPYNHVVKLFQRIRDESHRFAVSYHTVLKRKKQTESSLEMIPGIGPATRKKLIQQFGSLRKVEQAQVSDLVAVVGRQKAEQIKRYLSTS
ncbi:MAG TPA: excinuclease ABC subunit UvrC [Candidatus Saccharimonadales bacterium]